ncbi:(Fe-S)-binding protein [bacterium]|nr:(Fe-S)-binding protein [bacterium]
MVNNLQFAPVFGVAIIFFIWSCYRKLALVQLGKSENRFDQMWVRLKSAWVFAVGQQRVVKGPFGINHALLFWSFLILVILNLEFLVNGLFSSVSFSLLPESIIYPVKGVFDLVSLLVLAAVTMAALRKIVKPLYPESRTFEAFFILTLIGSLMVAYFGLNGAEIALGHYKGSAFTPISTLISGLYGGLSPESIQMLGTGFWWGHAVILLGFLNFLPYSKHMHILTAIPNCYFRSLEQPVMVNREKFETGETFGVGQVDDFSWKDLFDSLTCTECGRCQDICPATRIDKPLNPRTMIHSIKDNLLANSRELKERSPVKDLLISDSPQGIGHDAVWSCVTCGACMEVCPVFIEHVPKIVKMRRHLVETDVKFPPELLNLFENLEQRSNPWGMPPADRAKWSANLEVQSFEKDSTEVLLFVGCAGAFDPRSKQVTLALSMILDRAGISWGTLGKDELCCGDSARRLGNEYLFEQMALKNVALFKEKGVKKIVTQCPHCFTTLQNDYRQFGLELEVIHHSRFIDDLIKEQKIKLNGVGKKYDSVTFHDSCYLGRHNGIYDAPRQVIKSVSGRHPKEMVQNRDKSFCCGAGGGRMWLEENLGSRMNLQRVQQAVDTDAKTVCVSCPYCLVMFEDGLKDSNAENMRVYDLAEIVAESME